jgi:hypothetical protein
MLLRDPIGNPSFWMGVDSLVWWIKGQPLSVPVVTTGPVSQGVNAGNLGAPGTVSLNQPLDYGAVGGVNLFAGGWFDAAHTWGMEGSLIILGQQTTGFTVSDRSGNGNVVINEPVAGAPFSTLVSAPGIDTGAVYVHSSSEFLGLEINALYNLVRANGWTVNLLGGFRYFELNETLHVRADSTLFTSTTYTDNLGNTLATAPPGSGVTVIDQFNTHNQFYGGQIGAKFQYLSTRRWFIDGSGFLGIGGTHESININGMTNVYPVNGNPVYLTGGNYASMQMGRYSTDRFAVAPGFRVNVGYQFTPHIRASIGYNFLAISNVLRPGNQIDNTYDGITHPLVPMTSSTFWTQGLNLTFQVNF